MISSVDTLWRLKFLENFLQFLEFCKFFKFFGWSSTSVHRLWGVKFGEFFEFILQGKIVYCLFVTVACKVETLLLYIYNHDRFLFGKFCGIIIVVSVGVIFIEMHPLLH